MPCDCTEKKISLSACCDGANRHIKIVFLIIALFYVVTVSAKWWPTPDSSLYLGLGKSMISGNGYSFNGEISNSVTPGLPAILGGLMMVFGENYWVLNLFSALCAVAALGMAYIVIRNITNDRQLAFAVLLCTAMSNDYFRISRMILTDTVFAAIFWATMYCVLKFLRGRWLWLILAAIFAAAGMTVRLPGMLILLPLAAGVLLCRTGGSGDGKKRWAISSVLVLIIVATVGMFYVIGKSVSNKTPLYATAVEGEDFSGKAASILSKVWDGMCELPRTMSDMTISQSSMIFGAIVVILTIIGCVVAWRKSLGFLVVLWWLSVLAYAAASGAVGVRTRYLLALMPILFLFVIFGVLWCCQVIGGLLGKPAFDAKKLASVVTIFVIVIGGFNLPHVIETGVIGSVKSYGDDYYKYLRKGEFDDLMTVSAMLGKADDDSMIYTADVSRMYYLSGKVIKRLPSHNIKTPQQVAMIVEFAMAPTTQGYLVINMEESRAKEVTKKLDADAKFQKVFTGKYLKVYKK